MLMSIIETNQSLCFCLRFRILPIDLQVSGANLNMSRGAVHISSSVGFRLAKGKSDSVVGGAGRS